MLWTRPRRSSRKWRSESVVEYNCLVWQHDRGKKTRHNFYWRERAKGDHHQYCCTSWCKSRGKRKGEYGKVPGLGNSEVMSLFIGSFGSVTKKFGGWIEKPAIANNVRVMQKTALLGSVRKFWRCKEEIILLDFGHLLWLT